MLGSYPRSRCSHVFWRETPVVPGSRTDREPAELERPVMSSTEASGPLDLQVGAEPIHGYRLVRFLGHGGFGIVWEAEAPGGIRVALKFIRLDHPGAERELRALELIRNIRHPHLLDIQFAVRLGDYFVLAMPLCDQSLKDRLREIQAEGWTGFPPGELLGYMRELAGAIDYLNEPRHPVGNGRLAAIQHRDIKPRNILLTGGSARLADFGLAKLMEANIETHSGCMSPHYVAPEELRGQVSSYTDQYALAVTYYQLRTGRLPFTGTVGEVLDGHLHRPPNLVSLPRGESEVVARALSKRPEERWPSCREFVQELERVAMLSETQFDTTASESTEPSPDEETAPSAPARYRPMSHQRRAGLAAMALWIAGLTAVLSTSVAPPTPANFIARATHRPSSHQRRGPGFPARHVPTYPRTPSSSRRAKNQTQGGNLCAIWRFDSRQRGASLPRPCHDLRAGHKWASVLIRSEADVLACGPLGRRRSIRELFLRLEDAPKSASPQSRSALASGLAA